jgi:uncharacterized protein
MRIGLLSDTHIPAEANELPSKVKEIFRGVDLLLHAGDIYLPTVLDDLESIAPVLAAKGDDDYGATLRDSRVKEKHILNFEGRIVWLIHERPDYLDLKPLIRGHSKQDINAYPDIVIFGHKHKVIVEEKDNVLFINPGSPTFLNYYRGPGTIGFLTIGAGKPIVNILHL